MTLRFFCFLSLCAAAFQAHSATFCVTTQQGLIDAAAAAAYSPEDDEIRLPVGTLQINGPIYLSNYAGRTALRGGYSSDCATRPNDSAISKILGDGSKLNFILGNSGNLTIERLDFSTFFEVLVANNGSASTTAKGKVLINRSIFQSGAVGLFLSLKTHDARIENSVFRNNRTTDSGFGLLIQPGYNVAGPDINVDVVNCTFVNNKLGIQVDQGVHFAPSDQPVRISNTISFGNDRDVMFWLPTTLRFSIYQTFQAGAAFNLTADSVKNWRGDPMLDAAHRPGVGSRAIDSGDNAVFGDPIKLRDIYGNKRIENNFIDRGAVETAGSPFWGVF